MCGAISCSEHRVRAALLFEGRGDARITSRGFLRVTFRGLQLDEKTSACLFVPGVMPGFPAPWGRAIGGGRWLMTGRLGEEYLGYVNPELNCKKAKVDHVLAFLQAKRQLVEDAIEGMPD